MRGRVQKVLELKMNLFRQLMNGILVLNKVKGSNKKITKKWQEAI